MGESVEQSPLFAGVLRSLITLLLSKPESTERSPNYCPLDCPWASSGSQSPGAKPCNHATARTRGREKAAVLLWCTIAQKKFRLYD